MSIDPQSITIPIAILAGMFSFISPCVLPLVPAYIGYLAGQATNTVNSQLAAEGVGAEASVALPASRWNVFLHGVFFVIGFSVVFIVVFGFGAGVLATISNTFVRVRDIVSQVGGILIILLGLHTTGLIRIPFLYYDTRKQEPPRKELGLAGSSLMGITFAAGWSPCVGPILTGLIALGGSTGSAGWAILLFVAYSLGLGIPFLATALFLDRATPQLRRLQKYMRYIEYGSGILLILIGFVVLFGGVQFLSAYFATNNDLIIAIDRWLVSLGDK
jgi:cytochrome c-type biogenesis protein